MGCLCVAVSSQTDVHYSTVYHEAENENAVTSKKRIEGRIHHGFVVRSSREG